MLVREHKLGDFDMIASYLLDIELMRNELGIRGNTVNEFDQITSLLTRIMRILVKDMIDNGVLEGYTSSGEKYR
jgi:hypothetical protein